MLEGIDRPAVVWEVRAGIAEGLRPRRPRPGDKWHPDEVFIKINGVRKYLWRAVDQDGTVLDILVRNRRDKAAARRFHRRLNEEDSGGAESDRHRQAEFLRRGHREVMHSAEHHSHKGLHNFPAMATSYGKRAYDFRGTVTASAI
jgi:putative transposase